MNQIIKHFDISTETSNKYNCEYKRDVLALLIRDIEIFANSSNYEIVTISHNIDWIKMTYCANTIVVFTPLKI
jgi:hypothetical protein